MASIITLFKSTSTGRGKIIPIALALFTILLLANWRLIWGWFYYYTEYYNASSGEINIGGKCVHILKEPNFWKRVQKSEDWWRRMRCEGNLAGSFSQGEPSIFGKLLSFKLNPLEWYWVKTAIGIFKWELPNVSVPEENGFALLKQTATEIHEDVISTAFYVWTVISWAIITPFARAGTCVCQWTSAVYNFKLPAIALPDINDHSLVPASARELSEKLRKELTMLSAPPLKEWPGINSFLQAWSNIDIWGSFRAVGGHFLWLVFTPIAFISGVISSSLNFLQELAAAVSNVLQFHSALSNVIDFGANAFFEVPFTGVDQYMDSASLLWKLFFAFRYVVQWIIWPVMIIPRGLWSISNLAETSYKVLVRYAIPLFWIHLERNHPSAVFDFVTFMVFLIMVIFLLLADFIFYNAQYGLRGLWSMLYRLLVDIWRRTYYFSRRLYVHTYEILGDSVEWLLQNLILPIFWRYLFNPFICYFVVIPTSIYNRCRRFHPILRILVLVGLTLALVLELLGFSYLLITASYIGRHFSTFNTIEWNTTLAANPQFLGLKVPSPMYITFSLYLFLYCLLATFSIYATHLAWFNVRDNWNTNPRLYRDAWNLITGVFDAILEVWDPVVWSPQHSAERLWKKAWRPTMIIAGKYGLIMIANEEFNDLRVPIVLGFWKSVGIQLLSEFVTSALVFNSYYAAVHPYKVRTLSFFLTLWLALCLGQNPSTNVAYTALNYVFLKIIDLLLAMFGVVRGGNLVNAGPGGGARNNQGNNNNNDSNHGSSTSSLNSSSGSYGLSPDSDSNPGSSAGFATVAQAQATFDLAMPFGTLPHPSSNTGTGSSEQGSLGAEEEPQQLVDLIEDSGNDADVSSTTSDPVVSPQSKANDATSNNGAANESLNTNSTTSAAQKNSGPEL
ncbi:hypothetical protein N431DRAFT_396280 [Stipitochalara longipes BDJ]|nr:hypothetical protein N431DRAFT_396280 [Stipitochalara longipes BDJ]